MNMATGTSEPGSHPDQPAARIRSLDGLRGVAAVVVVFYHLCLMFPLGLAAYTHEPSSRFFTLLLGSPAAILVAGRPAVYVFFVLSGFVLAYSFVGADGQRYRPYIIKRICRIWLPFAAAILGSALLYLLFYAGHVPTASNWFNDLSWNPPLSVGKLVQHLAMTGAAEDLDNVMWSLNHEMRISIVFPLLVAAYLWLPRLTMLSALALSVVCIFVKARVDSPVGDSILETGQYAYLFVVGIGLSQERRRISALVARLPTVALLVAWVAASLLLTSRMMLPNTGGKVLWLFGDFAVGVGAAMAVALALCPGGTERFFANRLTLRLGEISYSLYLVHVPIILMVGSWSGAIYPALIPVCFILAVIAAGFFHKFIETNAQELGHKLVAPRRRRVDQTTAADRFTA
jgi:peptidoglycan/LPS O-acetylase OafA/YrhL